MYAVERLSSYISRGVYTVSGPFHPFGGAVDIIVVEQKDGSFKSSPWYVRFGKFQGVLKAREKVVDISVNGVETGLNMYLNHKGEAYFLQEVHGEEVASALYPSSSGDEKEERSRDKVLEKSQSYDPGEDEQKFVNEIELSNGKIMTRTGSRRSRILGLVFGRRSMREDRLREEAANDLEIVRASSLERAELAADLLEVKWSTNLASNKSRQANTSHLSASEPYPGEDDGKINNGKSQESSSVDVEAENGLDGNLPFDDEPYHLHSNANTGEENNSEKPKCLFEESVHQGSSIITLEEVVEVCRLDDKKLEKGHDIIPVVPENTKARDCNLNAKSEEFMPENACSETLIPTSPELEGSSGEKKNEEQVIFENYVSSQDQYLSDNTSRDRAQSFSYSETSETNLDGVSPVNNGTLYVPSEDSNEVQLDSEAVHISEVHSLQDTGAVLMDEHVTSLGSLRDKDSMSAVGDQVVTEYISSVTLDLISSNTDESDVVGVTDQDTTITETVAQKANPQAECVEVVENYFQDKSFSDLWTPQAIKIDLENKPSARSISPSDSSEEEQSRSADIVDANPTQVHTLESNSPEYLENHPFSPDKIITTNCESFSSPDNPGLENLSNNFEESNECIRKTSSPISIPKSLNASDKRDEQLVKSLPNIWSHAHTPGSLHVTSPLRHSLDSNSKYLNWTLNRKDGSNNIKSSPKEEDKLMLQQPIHEGKQISVELPYVLTTPGVEVSLCKHLLHEGMGAQAASQAFDSEKLDVEKFCSVSCDITKNDKLVVRIRNQYFPWEAAAPIILGMASFGSERLIEPKGKIAVEQIEDASEKDPPKETVARNGSWRIWPFSFKRSRSDQTLEPTFSGSRNYDVENASERNYVAGRHEFANYAAGRHEFGSRKKVTRKEVRTVTPTSEQVASLNLKEGRNIVTFTFSTAMLGKQQVDARIYLWKWNTRIVISDVDGTITKSDVLGQFMPMVGVDWSQTGVTHLFSAIKENGYQLIFLSARAISQAYLTRRFLFNLKQDGKALPDGPVVISPDGLFPSLFREVIRRAPHEFKIACLEDIKALFPSDCNPFYAGFGNRDTDEISYLKVGIPKGKIFIVNPKGQVAVNRRIDTKSYTSLHALVNGMFPPMSSSEQEDYNSWNFWRLPPPTIEI